MRIRRSRRRRTQLEILGVLRSNANENKPHLELRSGCAVLRTQPEATASTANGATSLTDAGATIYGGLAECGELEKQTIVIRAEDRGSDDGEGTLTEFGISGNLLSDVAHLEQSIVGFSKGYPNSDCEVSLDFAPTENVPADLSNSSEFSLSYNKPPESLQSISDGTEKNQLENVRTKVLELVETRICDLESVLFGENGIESLVSTGTFDDVATGYRRAGYMTSHLPSLFHTGNNDGNESRTAAAASNDVALFGDIQGIQSTPPVVRNVQHLTDADIDREIRSLAADLALRTRSENGCGYRIREDEDTPTSPLTIPGDQTPPEEEMGATDNIASDVRPPLSNGGTETVLHDVRMGVGIGEKTEDRAVTSNSAGVSVNSSATWSDETAVSVSSPQHHETHGTGFLGFPGDERIHQLSEVSDHFIPNKSCHYAERSLIPECLHTNSGLESYLTDEAEASSAEVLRFNTPSDKACPLTCQTSQNISLPVISADSQNYATPYKENVPLTSKERAQNHQASVVNVPSRLEMVPSNESRDKMGSEVSGAFHNDFSKENALSRSICVSAVISEKDASNQNLESSKHGDMGVIGSSAAISESGSSKVSLESIISLPSTNITVSSSFPITKSSPPVSTPDMSVQEKLSVGTQTNPDLLRRYFRRKSNPVGLFTSPKTSSRKTRQQNKLSAIASQTSEVFDATNPSPSVYSISTAVSQSPTSVRLNSYLNERHRLRHQRPVSPRPNASASSASVSFASPSTFYPPIGINGAKSTLLITLPAAGTVPPQPPSTSAVRPSLTIIGSNLSLNGCSVAGTALTPILIQASGISQGLPLQLLIPTITSSIANRSTTTSSTTTTVTSTAAAKRETDMLGAVSSSTAEDDLPSAAVAASISSDAGDSVIDSSTQSNSQSNSPELEQKLRGRFPPDVPTSRTTAAAAASAKALSLLPSSTPCQSTSRLNSNCRSDSRPRRMPSRLVVRNTAKSVETVGAPLGRTGFLLSSSVGCARLTPQQQPVASRCSVNQKRLAGSSRLESLLMDQVVSAAGKAGKNPPVGILQAPALSAHALFSHASSVSVAFQQGASSVSSEGNCHPVSKTKGRDRTTFCGLANQSVKTPTTVTHSISVRGKLDSNATVVASTLMSGKGNPIGRRSGSQTLGMASSVKTAERTLGTSVGNKYEDGRNEDGTASRLLSGKVLHLAPASLIHAILDQKLQQPDAELFDSNSSANDAPLSKCRHSSTLVHADGSGTNGRQAVIATNQKTLTPSTPSISADEDRRPIDGLSSSEVQPLLKSSAKNEQNDRAVSAFCRSRTAWTMEKKSSGKRGHDEDCKPERSSGCDQRKCHCFGNLQPMSKVFSSAEQSICVDKSDRRRKVISSCETARISAKGVDTFNRCKVLSSYPSSSSSSSSPCVVALSGSAVESPISISSSVATTDSCSFPCPEETGGGGGGQGEDEGKGEEVTSPSEPSNGAMDHKAPGAEEKEQLKSSNHKSAQDLGICGGGGLSRPQETDSSECRRPAASCSDAPSACLAATQLYTTAVLTQSPQPQSIEDWTPAKQLFWRASPGQATKCGAIALPKKVYALLGSALSKEHLSARRLTATDDQPTCTPCQPSAPSNRNPRQDTTAAPSMASESLSTPPPTPFYLVAPSSSSEDISAPPIKQLRLMCSGIPYGNEATSIASNSPPSAAGAALQPKRKPKKKKKQPTIESSECRRTPRIRKNEAACGSGQKEEYAGTRLTCNINSFARDHRLPVADARLLTR